MVLQNSGIPYILIQIFIKLQRIPGEAPVTYLRLTN